MLFLFLSFPSLEAAMGGKSRIEGTVGAEEVAGNYSVMAKEAGRAGARVVVRAEQPRGK